MKIKEKPEDFIVREVMDFEFCEGHYNYYLINKKNRNTMDVVKFLESKLHTKIGFAGLKDNHAITSQYLSVYQRKIFLDMDGVEFELVGSGKKRICLGDHKGNEFIIVIRDLEKELKPIDKIVNYFGSQRFSGNNVEVGRALVKGEFSKACELLELSVAKNDFVGALKVYGVKKIKFLVHAYQSWLWNEKVKKMRIKKGQVCIPGFLHDEGYDSIFKKEGITKKSFIIRSIPEISAEGAERNVIVDVRYFKTLEFSNGVQKISFYLPKGSYATEAIKQLDI